MRVSLTLKKYVHGSCVQSFSFPPGARRSVKIGALEKNEIHLEDPQASRLHATIEFDGKRALLRELGSLNGTLLNDAPVNNAELFTGDVIRIGDTRLTVQLTPFEPVVAAADGGFARQELPTVAAPVAAQRGARRYVFRPDRTEKYNTRRLIGQIRKERKRSRAIATVSAIGFIALSLIPLSRAAVKLAPISLGPVSQARVDTPSAPARDEHNFYYYTLPTEISLGQLVSSFWGGQAHAALLLRHNPEIADAAANLRPNREIKIPRIVGHTVAAGETLGSIAAAKLGTARRWKLLFEANRDVLPDASALEVGMTLKIPIAEVVELGK